MATRRSTRQRKVIPIEELKQRESEADAEFWGQEAFADDEEDEEFDVGVEVEEDVIDSDFDAPEERVSDGSDAEREARLSERKRKRTGYVDPARKKRHTTSGITPATTDGGSGDVKAVREKRTKSASESPVAPRTGLRNSTKRASLKAAEERAARDEEQAVRRAKRAAREARRVPVKEPTQEEKLAEAVETERANAESLRHLLRLEEERKRLPVRKKRTRGAVIHMRDREGVTTLSFMDPETDVKEVLFPQNLGDKRVRRREKTRNRGEVVQQAVMQEDEEEEEDEQEVEQEQVEMEESVEVEAKEEVKELMEVENEEKVEGSKVEVDE